MSARLTEAQFLMALGASEHPLYPSRDIVVTTAPVGALVDELRRSLAAISASAPGLAKFGYLDLLRSLGADRARLASLLESATSDPNLLERSCTTSESDRLCLYRDDEAEMLLETTQRRTGPVDEARGESVAVYLLRGTVWSRFDVAGRDRPDYSGFHGCEVEGSAWILSGAGRACVESAKDTCCLYLVLRPTNHATGLSPDKAKSILTYLKHLAVI